MITRLDLMLSALHILGFILLFRSFSLKSLEFLTLGQSG